jgi:hypothetical protein
MKRQACPGPDALLHYLRRQALTRERVFLRGLTSRAFVCFRGRRDCDSPFFFTALRR